ncbi:30S ribosomal protein S21 [Patescibacteria group bacterium]|jgi:small subunit ribosomal protein S21|nr:30S ribosomal protein S21 [Patescibacteria group bacterium]RLC33015.1 MAG: 30S ribosomal protein S21 [Candidatus Woesebacteria bacterium]MBU0777193.1 30S ribosomal protein S21 [Patescibacteria group bacterium]MBU0845888.1 30S ribosomal protein S21 [Patescibacteria group bacterium]MBU0922915.1 30S ribosomal protein S21 [Patescibacteria group bacterium]
MVFVKKKKGESEDRLIARFRKKVVNEGILFEIREKERYKKPSERRQEKIKRVKHQIKLEKKRD